MHFDFDRPGAVDLEQSPQLLHIDGPPTHPHTLTSSGIDHLPPSLGERTFILHRGTYHNLRVAASAVEDHDVRGYDISVQARERPAEEGG